LPPSRYPPYPPAAERGICVGTEEKLAAMKASPYEGTDEGVVE
jgi:hypothetical protein